jgi:hypothetical protein
MGVRRRSLTHPKGKAEMRNNVRKDEAEKRSSCKGKDARYWLAVNRHTATQCREPFPPWPTVSPTPEVLVGFNTKELLSYWKNFLVRAHSGMVREFVEKTLPKLARDGVAVFKRFANPEAPSSGTAWSYEGGEE